MSSFEVYFSLGSNLGSREKNIAVAISMMESAFSLKYCRLSDIIETKPQGFASSDMFLNAAVVFDFPDAGQDISLHGQHLLSDCQEIERALGRKEHPLFDGQGKRIYSSRTMDIDMLFYENKQICTPVLTVPHPEIALRDFVKIPLRQIASEKVIAAFPWIMD